MSRRECRWESLVMCTPSPGMILLMPPQHPETTTTILLQGHPTADHATEPTRPPGVSCRPSPSLGPTIHDPPLPARNQKPRDRDSYPQGVKMLALDKIPESMLTH